MSVDPLAPLFALFQRPWTRAVDQRRRALIARAPSLARVIDRSDAMHARMLPLEANEAAEILADVTMITTVEIVFLPAANLSPTVAKESATVDAVLPVLFEEVLGDAARVALEPHTVEARRRIPKGFAPRLLAVAVRVWPIPAIVEAAWPMRRAVARS